MLDSAVFADYVRQVTEKARGLIMQEEVGKFLSTPHPLHGGKSPIELIWEKGEAGFAEVMDNLDAMESGGFI